MKKIISLVSIGLLMTALSLSAQDEVPEAAADLGFGVGLGTQVIDGVTYQTFNFRPDLAFGDFGVGLDIEVNYQLYEEPGGEFGFYPRIEDWYNENEDVAFNVNLWLSKITYLRYGLKRSPIYAKFGLIEDGTLGNGFIMGNYNNGILRPEVRYQGLVFDMDGMLFDFPYLGFETFIGNLVDFDVLGGRLYTRPLAWLDIPLINTMQIGGTLVRDNNAFLHADEANIPDEVNPVQALGVDFYMPTFDVGVLNNAVFGDIATIEDRIGGMLGTGGRVLGIFTYGAQLRLLGAGFTPVYFDQSYDINRTIKYSGLFDAAAGDTGFSGWFATLGTSLIEDQLIFNVSVEGPLADLEKLLVDENGDPITIDLPASGANPAETVNFDNPLAYPRVIGRLTFDNTGTPIPVSLEASYDKSVIKDIADLISPENALIQAKVTYDLNPAEVSLVYNVRYVPPYARAAGDPEWDITSKLETAINF